MKTCELVFVDFETQTPAFKVQLYGVSRNEMLRVPPPVSIRDLMQRHGIDPTRFFTSPFHVFEVGGYKR